MALFESYERRVDKINAVLADRLRSQPVRILRGRSRHRRGHGGPR